jgi:cystathionine beta-lyase/cystathionine gamma-synthase
MIRLSVGIEDVRDLIEDIDQALAVAVPIPELVGAR